MIQISKEMGLMEGAFIHYHCAETPALKPTVLLEKP